MSDFVIEVNTAAEITVGSKTEKIIVNRLSMSTCVVRLTFMAKQYQVGLLRFLNEDDVEEGSYYKEIKVVVGSSRQKNSDPQAYFVNLKFSSMVSANHGVAQLIHAAKHPEEKTLNDQLKAQKNSLRVTPVKCFMCEQEKIPFWALQNRTMLTKSNIFGVPSYVEAMPRRDFCDYNLIRVVVCPSCYFASNDITDFQKKMNEKEFSEPVFDKSEIMDKWQSTLNARKKMIQPYLNGFFDEDRTVQQALLSYDLGIMTSDQVFTADETKDPRRRNYNPARKSVFYLMFKAEMLMTNNQSADAQKLLVNASDRLEKVFPFLSHEPSIRAGFLLGMLNLYQENYRKVGQYLGFLKGFNESGTIMDGTAELKTLTMSIKSLDEAYQNREEYSKTHITEFKKPF